MEVKDNLAPILLFVYNRPWHTKETLTWLKKNYLADKSTLIIYADGPKVNANNSDKIKINQVREIISTNKWCRKVQIVYSDNNLGLANSILKGISSVMEEFDKVIVLEDDIVTSKGFLKYMNDALNLYANEERIGSVSGYLEPVIKFNSSISFTTKGSSWGWATWRRVWQNIVFDENELIKSFDTSSKIKQFNYGGYPYYQMLLDQKQGLVDSWAIRFYAWCFLNNKLHIAPTKSLVKNIGFDGSGVHCRIENTYSSREISSSQKVRKIRIIPNRFIPWQLKMMANYKHIKDICYLGLKRLGLKP